MTRTIPDRESAFKLLKKYNRSESLIHHALAVEGVMRYMARKYGEDEEKWGIIGLIHDLDYELYPDQHCDMTKQILEENNWPDEYIKQYSVTDGDLEQILNLFRCLRKQSLQLMSLPVL